MKLKNGKYDAKRTCGTHFLLTGIVARYNYTEGKRGNEPIGYTYTVVIPACMYDTLAVFIPGQCNIEAPTEPIAVRFEGLELANRWSKAEGDHIAGEATGITVLS